jgi:hypothetical protein
VRAAPQSTRELAALMNPRRRVGGRAYPRRMQFLVVLVVAAVFVKYFWVLVGVVAGAYVMHLLVREIRRSRAVAAAEAERIEAIRARADKQEERVLHGDPRGIYGETLSTPV